MLQKRSMSVFRQQRKCNAKSNENYKLSFWLKWMSNSFWEEVQVEKTWMIIESHLESSRKIHLAWTWHFTFATWLFMVAFPIMLYFFLLCKIIIKIIGQQVLLGWTMIKLECNGSWAESHSAPSGFRSRERIEERFRRP